MYFQSKFLFLISRHLFEGDLPWTLCNTVQRHTFLPLKPLSHSHPVYPRSQRLSPHVIIWHHCTSFPLSHHPSSSPPPHPCVGKCWLTADRINSLGLEASFWRAVTLPVIHFSAGTNPCSYTQHAVTVGTTSPAPFHWKTSTLTPLHSWCLVKSKEGLCLDHNNFETHCVFMAVGLFVFLF